MPANSPVSLTRQTIYCFIPILDLYAAYRIKKLRWYLLIMLGVGVVLSVVTSAINPMDELDEEKFIVNNQEINWQYALLGENPEVSIALIILSQIVVIAVAIYVIRRWSRKWNMQFNVTG